MDNNKTDIHKVSLNEAFNNPNGKTSANKVVGVVTSFVCLFLFVILVVYYFFNPQEATNILALIDKTTVYFSVAAGVMGIKTISSSFGNNRITIGNNSNSSPKNFKTNKKPKQHNNNETERFECD